ncbi:MAG: biotin--[acetyl-CoA-carboxylase] ligase [Pseudoruegeria sp.]
MHLSTKGWPDGFGRRVLSEVDSTNAEAARIAASLAGPEWILALRQTAGRGRRGRVWQAPAGNFSATLVFRPTEALDRVALRSFVAALALDEAFASATGRPQSFALKWTNDVLLNGGKVAGILLETISGTAGLSHLCIGIGVNLIASPGRDDVEPGSFAPVNLQSETGAHVTPEEFLDLLANAYAHWEHQFTTFGFSPIKEAWLARAARLGEVITAKTIRDAHVGTFETLDDDGNLILRTAQERLVIPAAEVFF